MAYTYTRTQILADINQGLRGKIGMISNQGDFINRAVREFHNEVPLRSSKRKSQLTPDLFTGIYQYAAPADLADNRIIDIPAQATRSDGSFGLVPVEQFNTNPQPGDIAFDDANGVRTLLINSQLSAPSVVIDPMSSVTGWSLFGDGTSVTLDTDDYIKGNSSIKFAISAAGGTTAGIQKSTVANLDISDYLGGTSAVFVWAKINSATNLTNYILRIGSDSSNYYSKTITTQADGTAFVRGWNLLKFDLSSLTQTGTVVTTGIDFIAIYMTKTAGKISESDYKFNYLVLKKGVIHNVLYYSKYGWQTSSGAYLQNSTTSLDLLVADDTEYDLLVQKGVLLGMPLTNFDMQERQEAKKNYEDAKFQYMSTNPDESAIMVSTYHQQ
jgi:hypothetical protein